MDYGFAPGVSDYDAYMRTFISYRTATTLVRPKRVTTVAGFFRHLDAAPAANVPRPIGDMLIASHGNDLGWMKIDLVGGGAKQTDYDEVMRVLSAPAVAARLVVPPALYTKPDGTNAAVTVLIRGCRIGQSEPFMRRLMELFGGVLPVSAPKHLHMVYVLSSHGAFEYLSYGFQVGGPQPMNDRAQLLAAFRGAAFSYVGGNPVPDARWDDWIPAGGFGRKKQRFDFPVALGQNITSTDPARPFVPLGSITPTREFRHIKLSYNYTITNVASDPGNDAARQQALREVLEDDPTFDVGPGGHENPVPERFGLADIGEFLAGFTWSFTYAKKKRKLICAGVRHAYMVVVPLTDPATDPDPTTGPLLFNFYPKPGAPFAAWEPLQQAAGAAYFDELFRTVRP